jgi:glutaredoxin 3
MAEVIMYTKASCPYCDYAKNLLAAKNVNYEEIRVDLDPEKLTEMIERSNRRTVPQIFINGESIGGFDDLWELEKKGQLDTKLNSKE